MPRSLRERVKAWLVAERRRGRSVSELAAELGLGRGTVIRWSSGVAPEAIVPVRVVPDQTGARTVSIVSPSGFRIDGVTLVEGAALLREIG